MNNPCSVTQALNTYIAIQDDAEVSQERLAKNQWERVQEVAKLILVGGTFTDRRYVRVWERTCFVAKQVDLTFSMKEVAEMCKECIDENIFIEFKDGKEAALFKLEKFIGEMAHEVAFDALDLQSSPFIDLESLKSVAGA